MRYSCIKYLFPIILIFSFVFKGFSAEMPSQVVRYHLGFEDNGFFDDDFIAQSGKKTIIQRGIEFPEGKFGKGISVNVMPEIPDDDNMSGIDLDLVTAVMFNTINFPKMGFNEPFIWGTGKLSGRMGAVAFWFKGFPRPQWPLFEQSSVAFGRKERDLLGINVDEDGRLTAYLRDARYDRHELKSDKRISRRDWNHIVYSWDWARGLELWLNGEKIESSMGNDSWFETMLPGLFHLPSPGIIYDEFYLFDRPLKQEEIQRLIKLNIPPSPETPAFNRTVTELNNIRDCAGGAIIQSLPSANPVSGLRFTEIFPDSVTDGNIPGWHIIDGRNEMAWPHEYSIFTIIPGDADFHAEKADFLFNSGKAVNYVTLSGNLEDVSVMTVTTDGKNQNQILKAPESNGFIYASIVDTGGAKKLRIPFTTAYGVPPGFEGDGVKLPLSGAKRIHEAGFYNVGMCSSRNETGEVIYEVGGAFNDKYDFALQSLCSRDERRKAISGNSAGIRQSTQTDIGFFRRLNIFSGPFMNPTGVSEIKLTIPLKTSFESEILFVRVHDPAVPSRLWNQFQINLKGFENGGILELEIDLQDLVLTKGDRIWLDIATSGKCLATLGDKDNPAFLGIETTEVKNALREYAVKEMISARSQYSKMYEYMPWKFSRKKPVLANPSVYGGPYDIIYPALALKRVKPDDFVANFMEIMSGPGYDNAGGPSKPSEIQLKTFPNPWKAPDWAVYMREYNTPRHKIADWWAKRQNPDGQVAGGWNDDTLFMSMHMADLPLDCNSNARAIIDSVHTKFERTGIFRDGYCRITPIDRMHTGDFISERYATVVNNIGQAYAAEREMESALHSGHPEITPVNYGNGGAFLSSVNVLHWFWGYDIPKEDYVSKPLNEITQRLRLFASAQNEYTFYRYTESYVHTDDYSPYGSYEFYRYLLGGEKGTRWDAHIKLAVMWPFGGGPDMSRIVTKATGTSLEFVCYSFSKNTVNLGTRLCRISDGIYKITVLSDPEGKGEPTGVISETTKKLRRFDTVSIPIPPQKPVYVKITCIEKQEITHGLPDLAIDPMDVKRTGGTISVKIHNIGNAVCETANVRLIDNSGKFTEKTIEKLEAPTDFVPKTVTVSFPAEQDKMYRIILDPENKLDEVLEENNSVEIKL